MQNILNNPYLKLIRLHYSVGTILLLLPGILGIIVAMDIHNWQSTFIPILQISIGSFLTRSAGCIINDIIDRNLDKQVQRTKNRPLAAGIITVEKALICLIIILILAFGILLTLPLLAQLLSLAFFLPSFIYPCSKYFSKVPQLFLAPLFSSGAIIGFTIMQNKFSPISLAFFCGCFFWVLFFDTVYGKQDQKDDRKIGVGSMSLNNNRQLLKNFLNLTILFWTIGTFLAQISNLVVIAYPMLWYFINDRFSRTDLDDPIACKKIFELSAIILVIVCLINLLGKIIYFF